MMTFNRLLLADTNRSV